MATEFLDGSLCIVSPDGTRRLWFKIPNGYTADRNLTLDVSNADQTLDVATAGGGAPALLISRVSSSDVTTTGQTLVDIAGLTLALEANSTYEFEAVLSTLTSAVTTGVRYAVQYSAAGATIEAGITGSSSATVTKTERINAFNTQTGVYMTVSGQTGQMLIKGIVVVGANAGNLTIRHLKVTSGTSTIRINSFLKATKIA